MYGQFSNLYINYYYGSHIHLNERWGEKDAICPYSKAYYITHGECEFKIGQTVYHASEGDFFMIPSGTKHSFYHTNENYITKYWFHFDAKAGGMSIFDAVSMPYFHNFGQNRKLKSLFRSIFKAASDDSLKSQMLLNAKILELIYVYFEATNADFLAEVCNENDLMRRICNYINDNIDKNITMTELSEMAHFHPNYFIRFFKERMGIPPVKYINGVKVESAKSLLENTHIPVKEVMTAVGFEDYSHFSKFFKTYTGYSPTAFRNYFSKI